MAKAKATPGKAVVNYDEELARQAASARKVEESTTSSEFISFKGGILQYQDAPLPNNEMAVIIVDHILENVYYDQDYDPDTPTSPVCFAFGRADDEMEPHLIASDKQAATCAECDNNVFGSAEKGRGKACRNTRRLALIPAGKFAANGKLELFDEDHFQSASIAFAKLPVTSIKGWASFVKQTADTLFRPPHGIVTRIRVVPDAKTQFKVLFEPLVKVDNDLMGIIMDRHNEAMKAIDFPYQPPEEQPERPARGAKKPAGKKSPAAKRGKY